jgi:CheY-like chemotaxis protein
MRAVENRLAEYGRPIGDGVPAKTPAVRLLIIGDDVAWNNAVVRLLAADGIETRSALSGAAGLALARSETFDAILLDLKLPDVLGMTVLSELHRLRIRIPILAISGYYLDTDHDERAIQLGAAAFLRKPLLEIGHLAATIRGAIARYVPPMDDPAPPTVRAPSGTTRHPSPGSSVRGGRIRFPELPALHQRALLRDADAFDAIARMVLPQLRRHLRAKRPYAMPDWIEDAIVEALMEYRDRPAEYDPTRGLSLLAYLGYAAMRNLSNYQAAHRRHARHETTEVAPEFWDALVACQAPADESPHLAQLRRMLAAATGDFTPEERTVYALQMEDEHRTSVYARALHISHLPAEEQVRQVRCLTARVSQRVRRRLLRLLRAQADDPKGCGVTAQRRRCKTPPGRTE